MRARRIDLGGHHLSFWECGEGPPLLFGHSLTFDHQMFTPQAEALQDRHRVLLVDLHGHGASTAPDRLFTLEEMADDLARALDALDIDGVGYVGHSMGGMVGQRLALRHPDRVKAMALLNTTAGVDPDTIRDLFHHVNETSRGKPSDPRTVAFVLSLMFCEAFRENHPEAVKPFEKLLFEPTEQDGVYRAAHAVIWRQSILESLEELDVPTLVMTSDLDTAVPAVWGEAIAASVPRARLHPLEGCGHLSPVEQPQAVAQVLGDFFGTWNGS